MPRRLWRGAVTAVLVPAVMLVATALPAAADPLSPGGEAGNGMTIDNSRWPKELNKFVIGSPEYEQAYGTEIPDAIQGMCNSSGGDLWSYVKDFFDDLGAILDATSTATGQPWLELLDSGKPVATTPWDAGAFSASNLAVPVASDGGASVFATPGTIMGFDNSASPFGPCTNDFAPYGVPDGSSALGFTFYPAPDDASIKFMLNQVAAQPAPLTTADGNIQATPAQYWDPTTGADNPLHSWDFDPLDVKNYCTDQGNPFCATATFLHCPAQLPTDPLAAQNVTNCYTFNANVMLLNQKLALWLMNQGVPADSSTRIVTALDKAGAQAPLDQWFAVASSIKTFTGKLKLLLGVMAGGLLAGGLVAGGLPGLLIAAGIIAVGAAPVLDKVWGAIECGTDFFKCLAKGGVDALNTSMGMVQQAAATPQSVNLMGFAPLFNRLAGISAIVVAIIFLLTLAVAGLTGRTGTILPAGVGLVQWAVTIALGTTVVAALGGLLGSIANVIGGSSSTDAITKLARGVSDAGTNLPNSVSGGWLLAFIFAVIATIAGAIIWLVLTVAPAFIPLAVALMILQASGLSSSGWGRKWLSRGFGILWAIVLLRPTITLVAQVAGQVALSDGMGGIIAGSLLLVVAAIAPWWIGKQFPLAREDGFGMGAALLGGMAVASRFRPRGHRGRGGGFGQNARTRAQLAGTAAGSPPPGGPGGGSAGVGASGGRPVNPTGGPTAAGRTAWSGPAPANALKTPTGPAASGSGDSQPNGADSRAAGPSSTDGRPAGGPTPPAETSPGALVAGATRGTGQPAIGGPSAGGTTRAAGGDRAPHVPASAGSTGRGTAPASPPAPTGGGHPPIGVASGGHPAGSVTGGIATGAGGYDPAQVTEMVSADTDEYPAGDGQAMTARSNPPATTVLERAGLPDPASPEPTARAASRRAGPATFATAAAAANTGGSHG